jgi:hypothetical protein
MNFSTEESKLTYSNSKRKKKSKKKKNVNPKYYNWKSFHSEMQNFLNKQNLREFITTRTDLGEMLKGIF